MLIRSFFLASLLVFATACRTYSDEDKKTFDAKIEHYIEKKHWHMERSSSGLYTEQLQEGTGTEAVISGSKVAIAYKGTLLNGTVFDQTPAGKPLKSGLEGLIMGFQEGFLGQKKGARLRLIVPPQLGYGDAALEKIPQNSVLVFEVEIVDVH